MSRLASSDDNFYFIFNICVIQYNQYNQEYMMKLVWNLQWSASSDLIRDENITKHLKVTQKIHETLGVKFRPHFTWSFFVRKCFAKILFSLVFFRFVIFWRKNIVEKAAREMLMKLTIVGSTKCHTKLITILTSSLVM